jgi:hypothetical protein
LDPAQRSGMTAYIGMVASAKAVHDKTTIIAVADAA